MEIITRSGSLQILPKNNCPNKNMGKSNLFYPFSDCGELFGRAGVKGTPAGCLSGSRWLAGHLSQIISKSWRSHISWVWWIVYGQSTYYMYIYIDYIYLFTNLFICFVLFLFVCFSVCWMEYYGVKGSCWSLNMLQSKPSGDSDMLGLLTSGFLFALNIHTFGWNNVQRYGRFVRYFNIAIENGHL
jgi:hypothetical protein